MKLKQWLHMTGMKQNELAQLVGVSKSTINRVIVHGRILDPDVIVRIYFITFGAVRPDDFYDLESVPPDIQALFNTGRLWRGLSSQDISDAA
jgi:DNA-binding transcriptional regulator YdaS (Cro superfamily)